MEPAGHAPHDTFRPPVATCPRCPQQKRESQSSAACLLCLESLGRRLSPSVAEVPLEDALLVREPTNLKKSFGTLTQSLLKTRLSLVDVCRECLVFLTLKQECGHFRFFQRVRSVRRPRGDGRWRSCAHLVRTAAVDTTTSRAEPGGCNESVFLNYRVYEKQNTAPLQEMVA